MLKQLAIKPYILLENTLVPIATIVIFSILSYNSLFAQPNMLRKEEIYTLTANEVVAYDENSLDIHQDELGYIVVTADIKEFTRNYHINGKIYGPFDRRLVEKPIFDLKTWGFVDSKGEVSYVIYNGKEIGVHNNPLYPVGLKVAGSTWAYVIIDTEAGITKVIVNGKEYGPYASLLNYYLKEDGSKWAIAYSEQPGEYFVEFSDGNKIGPYTEIIDFAFLEGRGNRWVLMARKEEILSKNVNGQEIGQFLIRTEKGQIGVFEDDLLGHPRFRYRDLMVKGANYGLNVVQNQNIYYLANNELYGPYRNIVTSIDMGEEYNKFNYIVQETRNLHFKGDGIFSRNVERFYVSDTRRSVAVIKNAQAGKDSLFINDKYFKGIYNRVVDLKFAPNGEEWAIITDDGNGKYSIHTSTKQRYGPYPMEFSDAKNQPRLVLGKGGKNWALYYVETGTGNFKLLLNNKQLTDNFLGSVAFTKEANKEYFSWFSLEEKTVYLNKLLLE